MGLLGHSWGAYLALQYALKTPENCSRLILFGAAPVSPDAEEAFHTAFSQRTQAIRPLMAPLADFKAFSQLDTKDIAQLYKAISAAYCYEPSSVEQLSLNCDLVSERQGVKVRELMQKTPGTTPDLLPALKELQTPTLILHGRDDIIPLWTVEAIDEALPHSQLVILEKCGHFPYIEQPEAFFEAIHRFLGQ